MRTKPTKQNTQQQSKKASIGIKSKETVATQKPPNDKINPDHSCQKKCCCDNKCSIAHAPISGNGNDEQVRANKLFKIYIYINAGMLFFTMLLSYYAQRQFWAAKQTVDANKKEFEIENQPIIQVLNIIDTFQVGKKMKIYYVFVNDGKQPVKCIRNRFQVIMIPSDTFIPADASNQYIITDINVFLNGGGMNASKQAWVSDITLNKSEYEAIHNTQLFIYLFGYLEFKNMVTGDINYYEYNFRLSYNENNRNIVGLTDTVTNKMLAF